MSIIVEALANERDEGMTSQYSTSMTAGARALGELRALAARLGSDKRLIQGAGGNVSAKDGDTLWIKASGAWLCDALTKDMMVPVGLSALREAIAQGDAAAEKAEPFVVRDLNPSRLRPSIETVVHATMRQAIVLHVHSVDAIAIAVREDAHVLLAEKLVALKWTYVPYRRPGLSLARAISDASPNGDCDVLVLANHGLVVAAETVAEAEALLTEVVNRLAVSPRPLPAGDEARLTELAEGHGFRLPRADGVHALGVDPLSLSIAQSGVLYPDHLVFLGVAPLVIDRDDNLDRALSDFTARMGTAPKWVIVRGVGVILYAEATKGADAMARCLADVSARIAAGAPIRFLGTDDVAALLNWEAEKYRQSVA